MIIGLLSHLSHAGKLALLVILLLSFLLFSTLLGYLILMPYFGVNILEILTTPDYTDTKVVNGLKFLQILNMSGGLLLPSILYLLLTEKKPLENLGMRTPQAVGIILATLTIFIAAQPLIGFTNELNARMELPAFMSGLESWMRQMESQAEEVTLAFLSTTSFPGFLLNVFMIAILPAISEELLFRGVLARLFHNWTNNIHWAVFLSSFVFAAIHMQFFGFLPRFLLGAGLAYLFFFTGNLWLPILAHFINNFITVLVEYLFRQKLIGISAEEFGWADNVYVILSSLVLVGILAIYIRTKGRVAAINTNS
ncbi:MAG: CPBP family intramembrane metalloprotease [Bacteroidales bacterium]|nr:CPBP family intramembrane metalloprotease [Bacteroidales bacterium]